MTINRPFTLGLGALIALSVASGASALDPQAKGVFIRVTDTGPGFCAIIKLPGIRKPPSNCCGETFGPDRWVIYDAGNWDADGRMAFDKISEIIPLGSDIEMMVLSHTDADHLGAVERICNSYRVRRVLRTGQTRDTKTWLRADAAIRREVELEGCNVYSLRDMNLPAGSVFDFDTSMFTVVSGYNKPPKAWKLASPAEAHNSTSIVLRLAFQGKTVLFTGDAVGRRPKDDDRTSRATEAAMLARLNKVPLTADVLMAPHHGSDNASSKPFIEAVKPEYVVFSAGHRHGHPRATVAQRYLRAGVKAQNMLRTDRGDSEGEHEWQYGATEFADPPGDDDVDIHIGFDGKLTVQYRDEPQ